MSKMSEKCAVFEVKWQNTAFSKFIFEYSENHFYIYRLAVLQLVHELLHFGYKITNLVKFKRSTQY